MAELIIKVPQGVYTGKTGEFSSFWERSVHSPSCYFGHIHDADLRPVWR